MTKSKQINIAKEILTVLKIADPNSVLAEAGWSRLAYS